MMYLFFIVFIVSLVIIFIVYYIKPNKINLDFKNGKFVFEKEKYA